MATNMGAYVDARTLRFERRLPGTLEQVWAFLTQTEKTALWLAPSEIEPRVGGAVLLKFEDEGPTRGVVTVWEPPTRLAYTWSARTTNSEVNFELARDGDGVKLILTHHRLPFAEESSIGWGWHACLDALDLALAGADAKDVRAAYEGTQALKDSYRQATAAAEKTFPRSPADDLREQFNASAWHRHVGFSLIEVSAERLTAQVETKPELLSARTVIHGGAIAALVVSLGAFHAAMAAQRELGRRAREGEKVDARRSFQPSALGHSLEYLHPLDGRRFMAASSLLDVGGHFARVRVDVFDDKENLVATANAAYSY